MKASLHVFQSCCGVLDIFMFLVKPSDPRAFGGIYGNMCNSFPAFVCQKRVLSVTASPDPGGSISDQMIILFLKRTVFSFLNLNNVEKNK